MLLTILQYTRHPLPQKKIYLVLSDNNAEVELKLKLNQSLIKVKGKHRAFEAKSPGFESYLHHQALIFFF